ncbi:hypothetical protein H4S02_006368 [Coemansia sp. RSA 2611]|nr:hypothetical protein H4S01_004179 [Coemansia sp. RSA 2610]KAJ2381095.1 hypothetical protein H4S02_006368 [Coemansia sp. RSA 2611]
MANTEQLAFAIDTFKRVHPAEFQRRFLEQQTRHDGRAFGQFRGVHVAKGTVGTAAGSATVRVGNTTVVCGIKAEVSEPDVRAPRAGFLAANVELAGGGPRGPGDSAQVASEHVFRLLSAAVDLEQLSIADGQAAWALAADVVCVRDDGSVLDAALVALVAALEDVRLPAAELAAGAVRADRAGSRRLALRRLLPASFALVDGAHVVADADAAEEQLASAALLVVLDARGALANVWKRGAGRLSRAAIAQCVAQARVRADEVARALDGADLI